MDDRQMRLDYSSTINERLAELRSLERVLGDVVGPAVTAGVIDLLQRIALCSKDATTSIARVAALAARIADRRVVGERTIRNWRDAAVELGVLSVEYRSHRFGGHLTNHWTIVWSRVHMLLRGETPAELGRQPGGNGAAMGRAWGGNHCRPRAATTTAPRYGNTEAREESTGPVRSDPIRSEKCEDRKEPAPPTARGGEDVLQRIVDGHPVLADVAQQIVEPLPASGLGHGNAFAPLSERHLHSPACMVEWFRRSLSLPDPLWERQTVAQLILVLSAAKWAVALPQEQIKRNRVAAFVSIVHRGRWRSVVAKLDGAARELDDLLVRDPELLTRPAPQRVPQGVA